MTLAQHPTPALAPAFADAFAACPLVAILRGITPDQAVPVGRALVDAGFRLIEVPMNSPEPLDSIARLREALPAEVLVGAGTVLSLSTVADLARIGAELVISPHADPAVISAAAAAGLVAIPGIFTPTEAFAALAAGAAALKLFPAEAGHPAQLRALLSVLPRGAAVLPVGGIVPEGMEPWVRAGARGFGLGTALYRPGDTAEAVAQRAVAFVAALRAIAGDQPPR